MMLLSGSALAGGGPTAAEVRAEYEQPRISASLLTQDFAPYIGVLGGVELPLSLHVSDRTRRKAGKPAKHPVRELTVAVTGGVGTEARNVTELHAGGTLIARRTSDAGHRFGARLGAHYVHAFSGGAVYNATNPDNVRRAPLASLPGVRLSMSFEYGLDIRKRHGNPLSIHLLPGARVQAPMSDGWMIGPTFAINTTWKLGGSR